MDSVVLFVELFFVNCKFLHFRRQQIQHYTNQLAKETNKHLKEFGSIPLASSPSEQVRVSLQMALNYLNIMKGINTRRDITTC